MQCYHISYQESQHSSPRLILNNYKCLLKSLFLPRSWGSWEPRRRRYRQRQGPGLWWSWFCRGEAIGCQRLKSLFMLGLQNCLWVKLAKQTLLEPCTRAPDILIMKYFWGTTDNSQTGSPRVLDKDFCFASSRKFEFLSYLGVLYNNLTKSGQNDAWLYQIISDFPFVKLNTALVKFIHSPSRHWMSHYELLS